MFWLMILLQLLANVNLYYFSFCFTCFNLIWINFNTFFNRFQGICSCFHCSFVGIEFPLVLNKCLCSWLSVKLYVLKDSFFQVVFRMVLYEPSLHSYEPELFPGLIYRMVKPRIVLLIFVSGKVVLTGNKT